jgi:hypothetical protein
VLEDEELDEDEAEESFVDALGAALVAALALALTGLAAKDGVLTSAATAGRRKRATERRADLARSGLMAGLSKAKVARGSSDSVDY